jgi:hypothetical protein
MRDAVWLLVLAVAGLASRVVAAANLDAEELEELAARIAVERGAAPRLMLATIDTESAWNVQATNLGPGDAERGGAWGLTQLTYRTAVDVDDKNGGEWSRAYPGRPAATLLDPQLNLELAAALMRECANRSRAAGAAVGSLEEARNVAALWNSGRLYDDAPTVTRDVHVPRFVRHWTRRGEEPNA